MTSDIIKNKKIWVPERAYGICMWIKADGLPLSNGDEVLCAEGLVHDLDVEDRVRKAAIYWTGSEEGYCVWVPGGRKVSASERDDQAERLANGLVADPFEDMYDQHFGWRK